MHSLHTRLKKLTKVPCMVLFIILSLASLAPAAATPGNEIRSHRQLLVNAQSILFLGDSITYQGDYVANFETWLTAFYSKRTFHVLNLGLPSETVSGLSEKGHAGGRFPRPNLFTRVDSVLEKTKPDLIFACYGMNCGIYRPLSPERFSAYKKGILALKIKAEAIGAEIIFITPPIYDNHGKNNKNSYNNTLAAYSKWLVEQRQSGWNVIDLHSHMQQALDKKRQALGPQFTWQNDRIHPNSAGHWVMTQPLLQWFGDPKSAQCSDASAVLSLHKLPAEIYPLVVKKMRINRDAGLTFTGHTRPGIAKGLPLPQATKQARALAQQIKRLTKLTHN